ncbi:MAG: MerR family transcriptional regulator [Halopseudomonas sp.]|uniref:MerR family transcriptional regulator n=1 Tax=Halopseudomonas sp. TaxID=2901191 RepID=UPI00300302AB
MNMSAFAAQTGLSAHTLRYYEKIGVMPHIQRNSSGHRAFTLRDLEWVRFVTRLKETGMPLEGILVYAGLRAQGDSTLDQRQQILEMHRDALKLRIEKEQLHLQALETKIKHYQDIRLT